ncbi:hypothetical protein PHYC_00510 [Phycisphaerales bacterium]|nr:hypothetical protein PHYC_00510 [Phycisphaerales bacterium]
MQAKAVVRAVRFLLIGMVLTFVTAQLMAWNHRVSGAAVAYSDAPNPPNWVLDVVGRIDAAESGRYQSGVVDVDIWSESRVTVVCRSVYRVQAGWPLRAFESRGLRDSLPGTIPINPTRTALAAAGVRMTLPSSLPDWIPRVYLFRPLCIGLAVNSVAFGAVALGITSIVQRLVTAARKRARDRVSACHACGYSLKGVLGVRCPECGKERIKR